MSRHPNLAIQTLGCPPELLKGTCQFRGRVLSCSAFAISLRSKRHWGQDHLTWQHRNGKGNGISWWRSEKWYKQFKLKRSTEQWCALKNGTSWIPKFKVKNGHETPPPKRGGFMFQCCFFFLIVAFFCHSFSSLPLVLDIFRPKNGPPSGVWGSIYIHTCMLESYFLDPYKGVRELGTVPSGEPGTVLYHLSGGHFRYNIGFLRVDFKCWFQLAFWGFQFCSIGHFWGFIVFFSDLLVTLLFASLLFRIIEKVRFKKTL